MPSGANGSFLSTVMSLASVAGAAFTGGATLAMSAMSQAASQMATQAFSQAMGQMGNQMATQAFQQAFEGAMSSSMGSTLQNLGSDAVKDLASKILDSANNQGSNGSYTGDLDRAQQDLSQKMSEFLSQAQQQNDDGSGSSGKATRGGGSWLMAIAKAMGHTLGKNAADIVSDSQKLDQQAGYSKDDTAAASEFQVTMSKFQADSQMFSMLSSAFSTAIKSIGEGMSGLARKQ